MKPAIPPIRHTVVLKAPIARVWRALITPEELAIWLGPVGFAPRLGHQFHFQTEPRDGWDGVTHSEITALDEPYRLAFTWYVPGLPATLVTFTLRETGDQTEVTLEHSGWDQLPPEVGPIRDQLDQGWSSAVLPQLRALVEA